MTNRSKGFVVALMGIAALTSAASGEVFGDAMKITVQSSLGTGEWTLSTGAAEWQNDQWYWGHLPSQPAIQIRSAAGEVLATMSYMTVTYIQDPQITLNFSIQAAAADTQFTFGSGLLAFATIDAEARATAAATITDNDDDAGGTASVVGNHGGKMYRANYNGAIPGPFTFATLVSGMGAADLSSNSDSESSPGAGFTYIGNTSSMQAQFDFTLSANDSASGTSTFITRAIPAPGTLALLGLGMVAVRRRR